MPVVISIKVKFQNYLIAVCLVTEMTNIFINLSFYIAAPKTH